MTRTKIYLTCMSELYALTPTAYRRWLVRFAANGVESLAAHGKKIGYITENVTDYTQKDASLMLDAELKTSTIRT